MTHDEQPERNESDLDPAMGYDSTAIPSAAEMLFKVDRYRRRPMVRLMRYLRRPLTSKASPRRRRSPTSHRSAVAASMLSITLVIAGSWIGRQAITGSTCTGGVTLTVAAATEIAAALEDAARTWSAVAAKSGGVCVEITVVANNSATVASVIADEYRASSGGFGSAPESVRLPDVWVPESSTWLTRLTSSASAFSPTGLVSIAESPIVVAAPRPVAQELGWPDKRLTWSDILRFAGENNTHVGIVDPRRSAAGLAGLVALRSAAGDADDQSAFTRAIKKFAGNSRVLKDDLFQTFPRSLDATELAATLHAAPLSEHDVISYNAENPAVPLAALYLEPAPAPLNYPFAVLPPTDPQQKQAAYEFCDFLLGPTFRNAIASVGLRGPDGIAGAGFDAPLGAPASLTTTKPADGDAGAVGQALGAWNTVTTPGQTLTVFDVSGSMASPVSTAGGSSRANLTRDAFREYLALADDRASIGMWVFPNGLDGSQKWREVVPFGSLSSARITLTSAINQIEPGSNNNSSLYDTILAAYLRLRDHYKPGRVNTLLLVTDGNNEDSNGLTAEQLTEELQQAMDPQRPVRTVIIGVGTDVDHRQLEAITKPVNGRVLTVTDPAQVAGMLLRATS